MKPLSPETLIQNRYKIVHLIGKGGMGEVYLAIDQRLGSAVALKRTVFSDDEMLATAFEREARILANLRHPILPKVSDHFIEGENQYLIMEHIAGDDLAKRLEKTQQAFPFSWVLFWSDQLLDALHYLHTHQPPIIHRDIKPQNLKLTSDNQIVLLDFGLSKNSLGETKIDSDGKRSASTGSVVGYTPHYAPMEQVRGTGTSARSDIYSLSATIYQLLTNTVPPDALTRADSLLNNMPDPLKPISEINKEVSPEISKIILKGMEISQDKRHQSAREMQKILRDAYAKLQNVMSAQTVAFNLEDSEVETDGKESQAPIAEEAEVPMHAAETHVEKTSQQSGSDPAETYIPTPDAQTPDFDATLNYNEKINDDAAEQQSGVKTEVLLAGDVPLPGKNENNNYSSGDEDSFPETADFSDNDSFPADKTSAETGFSDDSFSEGEALDPGVTVPLIDFDGEEEGYQDQSDNLEEESADDEADLFADLQDEEAESTAATSFADINDDASFAGDTQVNRDPETEPSLPVAAPPVSVQRKKKSKIVPIILGLGAVFILLMGAVAGIGWYMYNDGNFFGFGETQDTPTPEETIEASPTPEPTVEELIGNTDELENANLENTIDENSNIDENLNIAETTPTPPIRTPVSTPVATPRRTQRPTPRATPRRTPRATPRKTPRKTPRVKPTIKQ